MTLIAVVFWGSSGELPVSRTDGGPSGDQCQYSDGENECRHSGVYRGERFAANLRRATGYGQREGSRIARTRAGHRDELLAEALAECSLRELRAGPRAMVTPPSGIRPRTGSRRNEHKGEGYDDEEHGQRAGSVDPRRLRRYIHPMRSRLVHAPDARPRLRHRVDWRSTRDVTRTAASDGRLRGAASVLARKAAA